MDQLILIHGAVGNKTELQKIGDQLNDYFKVIYYEIPGHGERSESLSDFNLTTITSDFLKFLNKKGPSYIFGFSLGGYLALSAALEDVRYCKGIVTLGTKFNWKPSIAKKEAQQLDLNFLKENATGFYSYLKEIHGDHLPDLAKQTQQFMLNLGDRPSITTERVSKIKIPVRLLRGGKDRIVTKEETIVIEEALENGKYFEIPSFIHPVAFLNPKLVASAIKVQIQSMNYELLETEFGKIAYQKVGQPNPKQPTLLFLHEALGSIAQWKAFPDLLCKSLETNGFVIELPGYGFSDPEERERNADYLHHFGQVVIPEIIKKLDFSNKILLVGHSDGGTNALLVAKLMPNKICGVFTMAAHIINEEETRAGIPPAISAYENGKMKGLEAYHGAKTDTLFYNWSRTWLSEGFKNWSIAEDIQNIVVPGLIIQGVDDQYGTSAQVSKIAACFASNVKTELIKNCGHAPHLEQTEIVLNLIKEWKTNLQ